MLVPSYHPANLYPVLAVAVTVLLVPYAMFPLFPLTVPPVSAVLVNVYLFTVQFAIYVLFPMLPFSIVTVVCAVSPLLPVQPANVYPTLLGLFNVKLSVVIVYVAGFSVIVPPF